MLKSQKNIIGYIHICQKGEWKRSLQILLNAIKKSNLYKNTNIIRLGIVNDSGIIINDSILEDKKFDIIHTGNSEQYERPTLLHMRNMAEFDKNTVYYYLHTKGISHFGKDNEQCIIDWINLMLYWNIENWRIAVEKLKTYDTYGCNDVGWHYSGNFWWATNTHIMNLPNHIEEYYVAPEDWIQKNRDNKFCVYSSGYEGYGHYTNLFPRKKYCSLKKYAFCSFWKNMTYDDNCFSKIQNVFTKELFCSNIDDSDIIIVNCFIDDNTLNYLKNTSKILIGFITEPIEYCFKNFYDLYLENKFDLIFGLINDDNLNNYYKYPGYLFNYNYNYKPIYENTNNYVKTCNLDEKQFCTLINTHDFGNTQTEIYNQLSKLGNIICPSKLFCNFSNDELNSIGNIEYIKKFKFNICSENFQTSIKGYITEKLLYSCLAGAIPIYCGNFDDIDSKIFNKNRIIIYNSNDSESINNAFKLVEDLMNDSELFNSFYKQDVFTSEAYDIVIELENKLINGLNIFFS
jgi:hypothetical protein